MNLQDIQEELSTAYKKAKTDLNIVIQEYIDDLNAQYPKRFFQFGNGMGMQSIKVFNAVNGKELFSVSSWHGMGMQSFLQNVQDEVLVKWNILKVRDFSDFLSDVVEMVEDSQYNINPTETRGFDMVLDRVILVKDGNRFKVKKYCENT